MTVISSFSLWSTSALPLLPPGEPGLELLLVLLTVSMRISLVCFPAEASGLLTAPSTLAALGTDGRMLFQVLPPEVDVFDQTLTCMRPPQSEHSQVLQGQTTWSLWAKALPHLITLVSWYCSRVMISW